MSELIDIPIRPGGSFSDIVENELGFQQHQEVKNLRMNRDGEWEFTGGYQNWATGFTNLKAGIEVTEDRTGDRFLLLQDGTDIKRIDRDISNSPLTGYENEAASTLTLPSGVTIGASATLRFFYFRGIVRITGASETLWYGHINARTFFVGDDEFSETEWILTNQKVEWPSGTNDVQWLEAIPVSIAAISSADPKHSILLRFFYVFDDGQYELLKDVDNQTSDPSLHGHANEVLLQNTVAGGDSRAIVAALKLRVNGAALKNNMFNKRITAVGIAAVALNHGTPDSYNPDTTEYQILDVIAITGDDSQIGVVSGTFDFVRWDSGTPTRLFLTNPNDAGSTFHTIFEVGYLGENVEIELSFSGSSQSTKVTAYSPGSEDAGSTDGYIDVEDDLTPLFTSTGNKGTVGIKITRKWYYDSSNGYYTYIPINVDALGALYSAFTGIPAGETDTTPDFSRHVVVASRAFVSGMTGDEADTIRFSPINQFDVFPAQNVIQTEVGDVDSIKAHETLHALNRIVMLKSKSISQGQLVGSSYSEDIGLIRNGLFPDDGYYALDNALFFMDKDDLYIFNGNRAESVFKSVLQKQFYQDNVDSSSFIIYNKIDDELWFVLGSSVFVWHRERGAYFYLRETDITPLFGFLDADNKLIVGTATKLVTFNGSTSDENDQWSFTTKIYEAGSRRWFKKLHELKLYLDTNFDVDVQYRDDRPDVALNETDNLDTDALTGEINEQQARPKHLFKDLYLTVSNNGATSGKSFKLQQSVLTVRRWRRAG